MDVQSDERGATGVEYGLVVALVAAVMIGTVFVLSGMLPGLYRSVCGGSSPFTC